VNWEIIADDLSKAGWSWGCVSALDAQGRTIWIADAHRDDGKRFIMHSDEKLSAFLDSNWRSGLLPNWLD
jgi:beta-xylosidase